MKLFFRKQLQFAFLMRYETNEIMVNINTEQNLCFKFVTKLRVFTFTYAFQHKGSAC